MNPKTGRWLKGDLDTLNQGRRLIEIPIATIEEVKDEGTNKQQLQGNLSRKGFVPIRESIGNVPWRIFVVVFSWRSHNADAQTPLS